MVNTVNLQVRPARHKINIAHSLKVPSVLEIAAQRAYSAAHIDFGREAPSAVGRATACTRNRPSPGQGPETRRREWEGQMRRAPAPAPLPPSHGQTLEHGLLGVVIDADLSLLAGT
ncbi:hypothetical protein CcaverHIS631_0509580 [Cutaneotrichosporon cavernicola]|nr:hypothetical protein CcaverHIS631_0509580 [Cutaneotrichosporon cavernicola]